MMLSWINLYPGRPVTIPTIGNCFTETKNKLREKESQRERKSI